MDVAIEIAQSLTHALELLSPADPATRPLAGGTDVMLRMQIGKLQAKRLVSIADLPELSFVRTEGSGFRVGSGTPLSDLARHPQLTSELPCLGEAIRTFASPQIRNRATIGGNIGNASPAADIVAPLIALGATVTLRSHRAAREVPIERMFVGFGKTALSPDELITEVLIPRPSPPFQAFAKFGSRGANVISVINLAIGLSLSKPSLQIEAVRIAFGSLAPKPLRAEKLEAHLSGKKLSSELIDGLGPVIRSEVSPIDDVRGSRRYKERLAINAVQDALKAAGGLR